MKDILHFFSENIEFIYLFCFTFFLGYELISKVPTVLHTPLMSASNAISGLVVILAILTLRQQSSTDNLLTLIFCGLGIIFGTINIVGGMGVTQRMLDMFKKNKTK